MCERKSSHASFLCIDHTAVFTRGSRCSGWVGKLCEGVSEGSSLCTVRPIRRMERYVNV